MKPERLIWFAFVACCLRIGSAQDFQHSYTISANGQIFIDTVSGNIKIQGYKGDKIEILAYKKGPDSSAFEIEDRSSGDRIDIKAHPRLPQPDPGKPPERKPPPGRFPPGGFDQGRFGPGRSNDLGRFDAGNNSADSEIYVPKSGSYNFRWLHSFNGNVEISNVSGQIFAGSSRGNIDVKDVHGIIRCGTNNGSVQVELGSRKDANDMKFSSMSGDIVVKAPANLDAEVSMSSDVGRVKTDYPIQVQETRYGPKRIAQGKLGSGKQKLTIESRWGGVSLLKK
jgi:hypothetical protein